MFFYNAREQNQILADCEFGGSSDASSADNPKDRGKSKKKREQRQYKNIYCDRSLDRHTSYMRWRLLLLRK